MRRNIAKYLIFPIAIAAAPALLFIYLLADNSAIRIPGDKAEIIIPTGSSFEQVLDSVNSNLKVKNRKVFNLVAEKKKYPSHIKPGRYLFYESMSYVRFIDILRAGKQTPVQLTFNNIRNIYELAGKAGGKIEADSASIASFLSDPVNYVKDGFTKENVISVFIPNTYELYWNTSAEGFYNRMLKEYKRFWNEERLKKAGELKLTPVEVSTLASIIDDEVAKAEEKPMIAGVYLNRLRRGMPLQACPTIKYALNDFTITRVLSRYLSVESPYNTYKHKGLPPGPIGCPTLESIDAVLNAKKHDYLYFAAKADFSGYHNFSRTLAEHNRYANEYQRELDKRKIFK